MSSICKGSCGIGKYYYRNVDTTLKRGKSLSAERIKHRAGSERSSFQQSTGECSFSALLQVRVERRVTSKYSDARPAVAYNVRDKKSWRPQKLNMSWVTLTMKDAD